MMQVKRAASRRRRASIAALSGITYFLRVEFSTDDAAPLTDPYIGEVGDIKPTQTNGNLSVASGLLSVPAAAPAAFNVVGYYCRSASAGGFSRTGGRAFFVEKTISTATYHVMGWHNAANINLGAGTPFAYFRNAATPSIYENTNILAIPYSETTGTSYINCFIARPTVGGFMLAKGGAQSSWSLLWVSENGNSATLYPAFDNRDNIMTHDYIRGWLLPAPFDTDDGIATFTDSTLASGDAFTGTADGHHKFFFTLNGAPSANDEGAVLEFRRVTTDECFRAKVKRNAGNTAWDFHVRSVTGGVESTPAGWTDVTGVSTPNEIYVIASGNSLYFYTGASGVHTKRGATLTNSFNNTENGLGITAVAGTTLTKVSSFPFTNGAWDSILNRS